jgi:hypothetical protein
MPVLKRTLDASEWGFLKHQIHQQNTTIEVTPLQRFDRFGEDGIRTNRKRLLSLFSFGGVRLIEACRQDDEHAKLVFNMIVDAGVLQPGVTLETLMGQEEPQIWEQFANWVSTLMDKGYKTLLYPEDKALPAGASEQMRQWDFYRLACEIVSYTEEPVRPV